MVSRLALCLVLCCSLTGCSAMPHPYDPRLSGLVQRMLEHEHQKQMAARMSGRTDHSQYR